ncbi:MAG TPA: ABC transporter substrate-binding protein, partial [Clostridia bacterium]|nr:ABC transporter substrate-binding protein [Clostridia bacterium]
MKQTIQSNYKFTLYMILAFGILLFLFTGCAGIAAPQQEGPESTKEGQKQEGLSDDPSQNSDTQNSDTPHNKEQPSDTKDAGDPDEFVYAIEPPKISLDPIHTFTSTEAQVYTALFEGLVTYHPFTLEPLPAVAKRWEISSDGTVYTFFIKENAQYSNGDPILAEHLKASWL